MFAAGDRYLQERVTAKDQLQLVGATAMFIASKFEEIYPCQSLDLVHMCDNIYTIRQLLNMEAQMLTALEYRIIKGATPWPWLCRLAQVSAPLTYDEAFSFIDTERSAALAHYLVELSLIDIEFVEYQPSVLAAAASLLARKTIAPAVIAWPEELIALSGHSEAALLPCARALLELQTKAASGCTELAKLAPSAAAKKKFAKDRFLRASAIAPPTHI